MSVLGTSWAQVHPSRVEPGVLMQINQSSQAFRLLGGGAPRIILDPEDLYVYMRRLSMRARTSANQAAANELPGASLVPGYISTPTYRVRSHQEWDHHDAANMQRWGVNIVEAYRLANRQGIFQTMRNLLLYGFNFTNSEGILNTPGATAVTLPNDSFGNNTILTYDAGQLAFFFLQQILNIKTKTYQLGRPRRFACIGPQRIIGQMEMVDIVQLTSFQRLGAGSATTSQMIDAVLKDTQGDVIEFGYDDTLIGQGAGSSDAVILILCEVDQPTATEWNTNEFAKLEPNLAGTSFMYADMAAPQEITVPLPLGGVDTLYELRASPGWVVRPEALEIISIVY